MVLNVFAAKQSFLRYIIIILYWIMLITYLPSFKDMRIKFSPRLLFTLENWGVDFLLVEFDCPIPEYTNFYY